MKGVKEILVYGDGWNERYRVVSEPILADGMLVVAVAPRRDGEDDREHGGSFRVDDSVVTYNDDSATRLALFDMMLAFFKKHRAFSGESVVQCDGPSIESVEVVADIADNVFKFKRKWDNPI